MSVSSPDVSENFHVTAVGIMDYVKPTDTDTFHSDAGGVYGLSGISIWKWEARVGPGFKIGLDRA